MNRTLSYVATGFIIGVGVLAFLAGTFAAPSRLVSTPGPSAATPSPHASPAVGRLPVHVTAVFCQISLDPGLPLAVAGREVTIAYLLDLGCTPQVGVTVAASGEICVTRASGDCLLHVAPSNSVEVTERTLPAGTQPLVNPLTVPLQPSAGATALFVNVPLMR